MLYRLNKSGFEAYLVGGGVRDLLLNNKPKDFDVCTNATPAQIQKLFRNCRIVGRRFQLAHIVFGQDIIEVATFRAPHDEKPDDKNLSQQAKSGMLLRDNVFGTLEQDAARRDFTINCLYYSVDDFTLRDFAGGLEDLKTGTIRLIGDPETRYREDPVRMLRAVRFVAKLGMKMSEETAEPIPRLSHLLNAIPSARLFDESLKLLQSGYGVASFNQLREYRLFGILFPLLDNWLNEQVNTPFTRIIYQVLDNTDHRLANDLRVNPAFLFAVMLWYPLSEHAQTISNESGLSYYDAFNLAMNDILDEQCRTLAIPKRLTAMIREIWSFQARFHRRQGHRAFKLIELPRFRAGFDLLKLRAQAENSNELLALTAWWEEFQIPNQSKQENLLADARQTRIAPKTTHSKSQRSKTSGNNKATPKQAKKSTEVAEDNPKIESFSPTESAPINKKRVRSRTRRKKKPSETQQNKISE